MRTNVSSIIGGQVGAEDSDKIYTYTYHVSY